MLILITSKQDLEYAALLTDAIEAKRRDEHNHRTDEFLDELFKDDEKWQEFKAKVAMEDEEGFVGSEHEAQHVGTVAEMQDTIDNQAKRIAQFTDELAKDDVKHTNDILDQIIDEISTFSLGRDGHNSVVELIKSFKENTKMGV